MADCVVATSQPWTTNQSPVPELCRTAWPALPLSDQEKRTKLGRQEHERLEHAAAQALSAGGDAIGLLLSSERGPLATHAPLVLDQLREARLQQSRAARGASEAPVAGGTIALGNGVLLATPVWTVAPMVTQSDGGFRLLTRRYGARLVYSEMLLATRFAAEHAYRTTGLNLTADGRVPAEDHPLLVQVAANDPQTLLRAALAAQACGADGVDINLGCPQDRAREGHYGSFLAEREDWDLVCSMITACDACAELAIPITCKIRLQPNVAETVEFARRLEAAGCALLAVHGRKRGNEKHKRSGPADLDAVAAVKRAVTIPVLSNGNVSCCEDALEALHRTGCDGIMAAEEILRDPALFARCDRAMMERAGAVAHRVADPSDSCAGVIPGTLSLAEEYLRLAEVYRPSSVWALGTASQKPCEIARHHLSRMLKHHLGAAEAFLEDGRCLGATSIAALLGFFRHAFARQLQAQGGAGTPREQQRQQQDDDEEEAALRRIVGAYVVRTAGRRAK